MVAALKIPRGARVVDVGAGSGYFSVLLARAVEPQGRVLALDQDPYAIWFLRRRLAGDPALARLPIQVTRARPEDPGLKPGSVDLVFMSEIHVFLERDPWVADWLEKLAAALAPGGRLAVLEHRQRPDGRPVSREDMIEAFRRGGLELVREHDVIPEEHLMELRPAR